MKSPLKVGLLKPMIVEEAEPLIRENWVAVAERNNKEVVVDSLTKPAMVSLSLVVVAPMPT